MHYLSFPLLLSSGLLFLLSGRNMCSFVPQGRRALAFDWVIVFLETSTMIFFFCFAVFSSLLKSILIVMILCFLIDDSMHWALIDLLLWYSFCIQDYEFSAVALAWLATSTLKMLQAILCLKEMLGFDWIFVFWRPKNLDFLFLLFFPVFYSIAIVMKLCFSNWW